jgi:hypothetical protein
MNMNRSVFGWSLVAVGLGLTVSACASASADVADQSGSAIVGESMPGFHLMPLTPPGTVPGGNTEAATPVMLTYSGGPVIPNVKVHAVYWGATTQFQSKLNSFYSAITNSSYIDWLKEYDTPTQQVRGGSFGEATVITPSHTGTSLKDADIQAEISAQIDAGHLPPPDGVNDLYMLHFPAGIKISAPGDQATSCVQFCAYHGTYKKGDKYVFYGIHPDLTQSGCNQGCGTGTAENNTTSVASHEMVEAMTDAAVGMATAVGQPPLAWYNAQKGEIGDICNGQQGVVNGFTVQKQWSNGQQKCVLSGPAVAE